jgi:hypothetical protein
MEDLNRAVQCRQSTVSGMISAMKITSESLKQLRTTTQFESIYCDVVNICHTLDLPLPQLPRQRRPPARLSGPAAAYCAQNPEEHYRVQFFQFMDTANTALESRYDQPGLAQFCALEKLLISPHVSKNDASPLLQCYPEMDSKKFVIQHAMFAQQNYQCKTLDKTAKVLTSLEPPVRSLFSQIECLTRLLLTVPVSNAEAERSFSSLRRLKTYLRCCVGQERLNHIALLNVHQDELDAVDLCKVGQEFVDMYPSRQHVFGRFTPHSSGTG